MAIKAVGFDFDGTLADTLNIKIRNAGRIYADKFSVDSGIVESAYKLYSGVSRRLLFDKLAEDTIGRKLSDDEYDNLSSKFDELNDKDMTPDRVYPDVMGVLEEQKSKGRILYVSSSVPHEILRSVVEKVGIAGCFDEIMGYGFHGTKGIGHTRYIMKKYGIDRGEIIFVGDELADVDLSKEAGVKVVAVTNTFPSEVLLNRGADEAIVNLSQLDDVLESG